VRTAASAQCYYVNSSICDIFVSWLVDTGAMPNVLDSKVYDRIKCGTDKALQPTKADLRTADGNALNLYGETDIDIVIGGHHYSVHIVVADLGELDGILGMSFLGGESCVIDTANGELKLSGRRVLMHKQTNKQCCNISVAESVQVGAESEKIVRVCIDKSKWSNDHVGLAEAAPTFIENTELLVSNALVDPIGGDVCLTCVNLGDKPVVIKKGAVIATLQPVQNILPISKNMKGEHVNGAYPHRTLDDIPEHLKVMAEEAISGLDVEQSGMVCGMIFNNQDVFVGADGKLGHTFSRTYH